MELDSTGCGIWFLVLIQCDASEIHPGYYVNIPTLLVINSSLCTTVVLLPIRQLWAFGLFPSWRYYEIRIVPAYIIMVHS